MISFGWASVLPITIEQYLAIWDSVNQRQPVLSELKRAEPPRIMALAKGWHGYVMGRRGGRHRRRTSPLCYA